MFQIQTKSDAAGDYHDKEEGGDGPTQGKQIKLFI